MLNINIYSNYIFEYYNMSDNLIGKKYVLQVKKNLFFNKI